MGDGKIGQNHFGRRAGHSNGSLRRRKVVTTCTSPCTTFLYSIDKRCTGNNSTCPVQCVGVFGDGGQTATLNTLLIKVAGHPIGNGSRESANALY